MKGEKGRESERLRADNVKGSREADGGEFRRGETHRETDSDVR